MKSLSAFMKVSLMSVLKEAYEFVWFQKPVHGHQNVVETRSL